MSSFYIDKNKTAEATTTFENVKLERDQTKGTLTEYVGFTGKHQTGFAYFDREQDSWVFRPEASEDFIRVPFYALEMNLLREDKSKKYYFEAKYTGLNKEIAGKVGRVYPQASKMFRFRLEGQTEEYNVNPINLKY